MPSLHAAQQHNGRDVTALETEVNLLKAELEETKRRLESDVARAKEEALGVMRATGDTHTIKRLCRLLRLEQACMCVMAGGGGGAVGDGMGCGGKGYGKGGERVLRKVVD